MRSYCATCEKWGHSTELQARRAAQSALARPDIGRARLYVYEGQTCGWWHLTKRANLHGEVSLETLFVDPTADFPILD